MGLSQNIANRLSTDCSNSMSGDGNSQPTPASILGAAYFGDWDLADPGVVLSGGGTVVSSVPNKGLDGAAMTATPGTGGAWEAAGFGGAPSMLLNNGSFLNAMSAVFNTPIPAGSRVFVWAAMQAGALPGGQTGIAFDLQSADGSRSFLHYVYNTSGWSVLVTVNGGAFVTGNPIGGSFDTNRHFYGLGNVAGGVGAYELDNATGNLVGANATGVTDAPLTRMLITGYGNGADQRAHVRLARMIITNAEPTALQRAAMKDYFKRTYSGLSL